jgi:hypothetical protein
MDILEGYQKTRGTGIHEKLIINETLHKHLERDASKHKNEVLVHTDLGIKKHECHMI